MEEPLSPNAYRNRNLRLRRKINREKKIFEDRLAAVVLQFSTQIDLDILQVTEIAKGRIRAYPIRNVKAVVFSLQTVFLLHITLTSIMNLSIKLNIFHGGSLLLPLLELRSLWLTQELRLLWLTLTV